MSAQVYLRAACMSLIQPFDDLQIFKFLHEIYVEMIVDDTDDSYGCEDQ